LRWNEARKEVEIDTSFPDLPEKCSYLSATVLQDRIYGAGGKNEINPEGMKNFWMLDLSNRSKGNFTWKTLPMWPGNARYGTVLGSQNAGYNDCIYLSSGRNGSSDYFKDVFQFRPIAQDSATRWTRKSDMPRAAMVASSTSIGQTHVLVFSGSDGH